MFALFWRKITKKNRYMQKNPCANLQIAHFCRFLLGSGHRRISPSLSAFYERTIRPRVSLSELARPLRPQCEYSTSPLRSVSSAPLCLLCWIISSVFSSINPASYAGIVMFCCLLLAAIPASSLLRILSNAIQHFFAKNLPFLAHIKNISYLCTRKGFITSARTY